MFPHKLLHVPQYFEFKHSVALMHLGGGASDSYIFLDETFRNLSLCVFCFVLRVSEAHQTQVSENEGWNWVSRWPLSGLCNGSYLVL